MLKNLWESFIWMIGANEVDPAIPIWQLILRTIVIYLVALLVIRIGKRRFMGGYTTFDILLGFVVGSVMSRAITGAVRFIDMLVVVAGLVILHWIIATISFYSERFGKIVENTTRKLVIDGEIQKDEMRKSKIGKKDLMEAVRQGANIDSLDRVKTAYLERDGNITIIPHPSEPHIVEVKVEDGVQTVRILFEN